MFTLHKIGLKAGLVTSQNPEEAEQDLAPVSGLRALRGPCLIPLYNHETARKVSGVVGGQEMQQVTGWNQDLPKDSCHLAI